MKNKNLEKNFAILTAIFLALFPVISNGKEVSKTTSGKASKITSSKVKEWKIIDSKSSIKFKVAQNKSLISGSFKNFSGRIAFDPKSLEKSEVKIEVDISSIETSIPGASETLQNKDWFASKIFPKAIFSSKSFSSKGKEKFLVNGDLSIKDKSLPTKLEFELIEYSENSAHAKGKTVINRSSFNVGNPDPSKSNDVANDVEINFEIFAE